MPSLISSPRAARAAVLLAVVLLPLKAGGCAGSSACINVPQSTYAASGCPSRAAAGSFFASSCAVESVDGDATYDGELCCYPVTPTGNGDDCNVPVGFGGGVVGMTAGVSGSGGAVVAVGSGVVFDGGGFGGSGSGGFGGFVPVDAGCASCAQTLSEGLSGSSVCPGAAGASFMSLVSCACTNCPTQCAATLCDADGGLAGDCQSCIKGPCGGQLESCLNN
jgi:hypothetical protein